jgi:PKD repeat protein
VEGNSPLTVSFTVVATDNINSYHWDFGDGTESEGNNPVHIYKEAGKYTVILVVDGANGIDIEKKTDYIVVEDGSNQIEETVPSNEIIDWGDAGNYLGEYKTVEGIIRDAYYASNTSSKPTFLNFNIPYDGYFTCVIWGSDRHKFVNEFHSSPETYLLKKLVRVTGVIVEYPEGSGVPEMILEEPAQIEIMDSD